MDGLPLWLRVGLAGLLIGTIAAAFVGRPPRRRPRTRTWRWLAAAAAACYAAGVAAFLSGAPILSAGLVGLGVEALSVAAWLGRAPGEEPASGDGPSEHPAGGDDSGHGGPGRWGPDDDRAFWDEVGRAPGPRAPVSG
jgi:hypothetical protein